MFQFSRCVSQLKTSAVIGALSVFTLSAVSLTVQASGTKTVESQVKDVKNKAHKKLALAKGDIDSILLSQPVEVQARYEHRHPKETLEFFKIKPGMKVMEVLPGRGWYTKILLPLIGSEGELVGVDYPQSLWPHFSFMTPDALEAKKTWVSTWTKDASSWGDENSAKVSAFQFAEMPKSYKSSLDAALFIRALHNLNRHEDKGDYIDPALKETFEALKPGGLLGVVQHEAREDRPDSWADGNNGYLKKSFVKKKMAEHGFEFVAESDVNSNPKDQANVGDSVWRLPPSSRSKSKDEKYLQSLLDIGETNRMTLLFKKPDSKK